MSEGFTNSGAQLPYSNINIRSQVESILQEVIGDNHGDVSINKRGTVTIPWPTRDNIPVSEFTTQYFFTLAFPVLFLYGCGDFYINRSNTCSLKGDWAEHLLWYNDGRFAKHPSLGLTYTGIAKSLQNPGGWFTGMVCVGDQINSPIT